MWFRKKKEEENQGYFTENWLNKWKINLEKSETYKRHGRNWNAPILLKVTPPVHHWTHDGYIGIFLNLKYGKCEEIRFAKREDEDIADVILTADEQRWIRLLESKSDPTRSLMTGKLKLEKGSLVLLSTQQKAAKSLLETAPVFDSKVIETARHESPIKKDPSEKSSPEYKTVSSGLDHDSFPMKLFQKAKIYGIWNPSEIDFEKDAEQYKTLTAEEKGVIHHLSALFMAGEEAVTLELLPLIQAIAGERRIEEEIFLTSFLWEEAKHTEFFSLYTKRVFQGKIDYESYHDPFYKVIFYNKLPSAMSALKTDTSTWAQLKAAATYNMIVEGTLAETGYAAYHKMLIENDLLPGLTVAIEKLKQDESRHIAFGIYLINRLLKDAPQHTTPLQEELYELLNDSTNIIHEIFERYPEPPFGLDKEWFLNYALKQFQARMDKIGLS